MADTPVIDRIRVYTKGFGSDRYSWSALMPLMVNTDTITRVSLSDGSEGMGAVCSCVEHGVDLAIAHGIRPLLPGLLGQGVSDIHGLWEWMIWRKPYIGNPSIAAIDIALWDLAARRAGQPLYQYLGGTRDRIQSYASIPVLENHDANIRLINRLAAEGVTLFKFHYECQADADIGLIEAIDDAFGGSGIGFMFDAECAYSPDDALRVATAAEKAGFLWLEAPMPDRNLADYAVLKSRTGVPVLPAGITIADEADIANALQTDAWSAIRCDTASSGGITPMRRIASLAESHGMKFELQSWGSSLSTAANFHLTLATPHSSYFEVPVPRQDFDIPGVTRLHVDDAGDALAPAGHGLGLDVNWDELEAGADLIFDTSA